MPKGRCSLKPQQVEDPAFSQLWLGFDPWPGNFCMPHVEPEKKKKKADLLTLVGPSVGGAGS